MESARGSGKQGTVSADLFSIHGLVAEKGGNGAVAYAQSAAISPGPEAPPSLLDALAGRTGRRIVDAASATMTREIEGGSEVGYSYSGGRSMQQGVNRRLTDSSRQIRWPPKPYTPAEAGISTTSTDATAAFGIVR